MLATEIKAPCFSLQVSATFSSVGRRSRQTLRLFSFLFAGLFERERDDPDLKEDEDREGKNLKIESESNMMSRV